MKLIEALTVIDGSYGLLIFDRSTNTSAFFETAMEVPSLMDRTVDWIRPRAKEDGEPYFKIALCDDINIEKRIEDIAIKCAYITDIVDPYGFSDAYKDVNEAADHIAYIIKHGDSDCLVSYFKDFLDVYEEDDDKYEEIYKLITELKAVIIEYKKVAS